MPGRVIERLAAILVRLRAARSGRRRSGTGGRHHGCRPRCWPHGCRAIPRPAVTAARSRRPAPPARRRPQRRVEMLLCELGAVTELRCVGRPGTGPGVAVLVPDRHEPVLPSRVEEVGVGEVEALHIDDPDQHVLAVVMLRCPPEPALRRRRRRHRPAGHRRGRLLEGLADLHIGDTGVLRQRRKTVQRDPGRDQVPLAGPLAPVPASTPRSPRSAGRTRSPQRWARAPTTSRGPAAAAPA